MYLFSANIITTALTIPGSKSTIPDEGCGNVTNVEFDSISSSQSSETAVRPIFQSEKPTTMQTLFQSAGAKSSEMPVSIKGLSTIKLSKTSSAKWYSTITEPTKDTYYRPKRLTYVSIRATGSVSIPVNNTASPVRSSTLAAITKRAAGNYNRNFTSDPVSSINLINVVSKIQSVKPIKSKIARFSCRSSTLMSFISAELLLWCLTTLLLLKVALN